MLPGQEGPKVAMNRRYWLSWNANSGAHNGPSVVGPGPGPEKGAAFEKPGRSIFAPGTAGVDPMLPFRLDISALP